MAKGANSKTTQQVDKEMEYIYFARAYLRLAYFSIEKLKDNPFEEIIPDMVAHDNYVLVPVFYNIKHAIEIFIKGIYEMLSISFEKSGEHGHDIKYLFEKLKKHGEVKNNNSLKEKVSRAEKLVEKYHHLSFLLKKLGSSVKIEDVKNDIFRYPSNNAKILFDFSVLLPQFTDQDINEVKKDMKEIDRLFYEIGSAIIGKPKIKESLTIKNVKV